MLESDRDVVLGFPSATANDGTGALGGAFERQLGIIGTNTPPEAFPLHIVLELFPLIGETASAFGVRIKNGKPCIQAFDLFPHLRSHDFQIAPSIFETI